MRFSSVTPRLMIVRLADQTSSPIQTMTPTIRDTPDVFAFHDRTENPRDCRGGPGSTLISPAWGVLEGYFAVHRRLTRRLVGPGAAGAALRASSEGDICESSLAFAILLRPVERIRLPLTGVPSIACAGADYQPALQLHCGIDRGPRMRACCEMQISCCTTL